MASPLLWQLLLPIFRGGFEITSPTNGERVNEEWVTIRGKYLWLSGLEFYIFRQHGNQLWPQGSPRIEVSHLNKTWEKRVHFGNHPGEDQKLLLVVVSPEIKCLIDYYNKVGESKGWVSITANKPLPGVTVFQAVTVQLKMRKSPVPP